MSAFAALLDAVKAHNAQWNESVDYDRGRRERVQSGELVVTHNDAANTRLIALSRETLFCESLIDEVRDEVSALDGHEKAIGDLIATAKRLHKAAAREDKRNGRLEDTTEWTKASAAIQTADKWMKDSGAINLGRGSLDDILARSRVALRAIDERLNERPDCGEYLDAMHELRMSAAAAVRSGNLRWLEDHRIISRDTADDIEYAGEIGVSGREFREALKRLSALAETAKNGNVTVLPHKKRGSYAKPCTQCSSRQTSIVKTQKLGKSIKRSCKCKKCGNIDYLVI